MGIPNENTFECWVDKTKLRVDIGSSAYSLDVLFTIDEKAAVLIKDIEQVTMLRDMLTVWLSRNGKQEVRYVDVDQSESDSSSRCVECGDWDCNGQCMEIP